MSGKYLNLAKKYFDLLTEKGIKVRAGYVFGSRVKGNYRPESDLDICVVLDDFGDDYYGERVRLAKLGRGVSVLIEPHPMTNDDFEDKYNPLAVEVKRTGIRVI